MVGNDGLDLAQLDVWEISPDGQRTLIEEKDGTKIGTLNPATGRPFRDPTVAVEEFADIQVLEAGRRKAFAVRNAVRTRGDDKRPVPSIDEVRKATTIRFEIRADTPELRVAVEARLVRLRSEFPSTSFEARYGVDAEAKRNGGEK
jgi:hypothetical protein